MDRMHTATATCPPDDLLSRLDVMSEEQMIALANITPGTAAAWRKRSEGPPWVRLGNAYYYPVPHAKEFLSRRVRVPAAAAGATL